MLKFFRSIRSRLLLEGKFRKYLIYGAGEILLVNDEDDMYRLDLHRYFLSFFGKHYTNRNITLNSKLFGREMSLGKSKFPLDLDALLNYKEFENLLTFQNFWKNTTLTL